MISTVKYLRGKSLQNIPKLVRLRSGLSQSLSQPARAFSSEPSLIVHGFGMSQPTRSILYLLEETGTPYTLNVVDATKGENRKPAFTKEFPAGQVPVIEHDGFKLGESPAILQYLCNDKESFPKIAEKWYPSDLKTRARVDQWLHYHHGSVRPATSMLLHAAIWPKPFSWKWEPGHQTLRRTLRFMEAELETLDGKFLAGTSEPTIADLLLIGEFDQHLPGAFALLDFAPFPHVQAWMDRIIGSLTCHEKVYEPVLAAAANTPLTIPEKK